MNFRLLALRLNKAQDQAKNHLVSKFHGLEVSISRENRRFRIGQNSSTIFGYESHLETKNI